MTPGELSRAIRERKFPPLLFLFGENSFFLNRAVEQLKEAAVPAEACDFNFNQFYGKETRPEAVLDTVRTFPVFAERRLVLVKAAQELTAAQLEAFLPYLTQPLPETILLFVADKIDKRRKFFQLFQKHGALVEFKKPYDNQIPAFIREQAAEAGRSLTETAMALFCRRVGTDLEEIHGELVKLFAYLGERTLADEADVAAVVSDTRVNSVFDLTNALGQQQLGEALRLLHRLLQEGLAPLLILSMVVRHLRQLWKIRTLVEKHTPSREIAQLVKLNPYFVEGMVAQARRFPLETFPSLFVRCLETDLALKSSGAHAGALLEMLLVEIGRMGAEG